MAAATAEELSYSMRSHRSSVHAGSRPCAVTPGGNYITSARCHAVVPDSGGFASAQFRNAPLRETTGSRESHHEGGNYNCEKYFSFSRKLFYCLEILWSVYIVCRFLQQRNLQFFKRTFVHKNCVIICLAICSRGCHRCGKNLPTLKFRASGHHWGFIVGAVAFKVAFEVALHATGSRVVGSERRKQ